MRILLVRHGETHHNVQRLRNGIGPSSLTNKGVSQARQVAARLASEKIAMIYCSDLGRTRQTAAEILKTVDAPIKYVPELRERDQGVFENTPYGHYKHFLKENGHDLVHYKPEGGESIAEAAKRAMAFYQQCIEKHRGETIVWVSHGGIIYKVLRHALKDLPSGFHPDNCALSVLELDDDLNPKVSLFNCTLHLDR